MRVVVKKSLKMSRIRAETGTVGPTLSVNGSTVTELVSFHCRLSSPVPLPPSPLLGPWV